MLNMRQENAEQESKLLNKEMNILYGEYGEQGHHPGINMDMRSLFLYVSLLPLFPSLLPNLDDTYTDREIDIER